MISPNARAFVTALSLTLALASVNAIDWPEDYVVSESSKSPNGQYAIILPGDEPTTEDADNYLVNVKAHKVLGKIEGADYFEHQNHAGLVVEWSADSKWCAATYWGRFGFGSIILLEPKGSTFAQTEIGERVQNSLDAAMKKESHDKEMRGDAGPHFRFGPGRKLRVRAVANNNPKQFADVKTYYALFQGTYDLDSKKWTVTDTHSVTSQQDEALEVAYADLDQDLDHSEYPTEKDKFDALDEKLNSVYQAAQFLLPAARFATLKQEQREWLKKRDTTKSDEEKSKLTENRIKALQDLLW